MELIDKADIEKILSNLWKQDDGHNSEHRICYNKALQEVQCELDTLEVKESENERIRKELVNYFTEGREFLSLCSFGRDKILAWLEKQGNKPQGKKALEAINEQKADNANKIEPKTKQEWSDEDEGFLRAAIKTCLENYGQYSEIAIWLKSLKQRYISLKQRYIWKPSDKQIRALRWVLNNIPYNTHKEEISGLLDQIKDL